jgi:hypothetical protein
MCLTIGNNRFQGLTPYEFVEGMKKKGIRVPGIGHRYVIIKKSFNTSSYSFDLALNSLSCVD